MGGISRSGMLFSQINNILADKSRYNNTIDVKSYGKVDCELDNFLIERTMKEGERKRESIVSKLQETN